MLNSATNTYYTCIISLQNCIHINVLPWIRLLVDVTPACPIGSHRLYMSVCLILDQVLVTVSASELLAMLHRLAHVGRSVVEEALVSFPSESPCREVEHQDATATPHVRSTAQGEGVAHWAFTPT